MQRPSPRPAPVTELLHANPISGSPAPRLRSLDVFRGLTVAGMLLVNNPGSWDAVYAPLRHAPWHGWTPTDLIFPFFLFIVGITTELSLRARARRGDGDAAVRHQIVRRAALILLLGLALNWFPFYQGGDIAGHPSPTALDRVLARLTTMRIPGVLPRIALAYFAAALVSWRASNRRIIVTAAALLVGYWAALTLVPVPGFGAPSPGLRDPDHTLVAWLDQLAFDWRRWGGGNHLYDDTRTYDPEGLLSTLPAVATTLLGVLAGRWLTADRPFRARVAGLVAAGGVGTGVGLAWDLVFPINKHLWTSSYVVLTAGCACLALAACVWLVDARGARRWTEPFVVFGSNPLVAFAGSEVLPHFVHSTFKTHVGGRRVGLDDWLTLTYGRAGLPPAAASLGYAVTFVAVWYFLLRWLYRRGLVLRF